MRVGKNEATDVHFAPPCRSARHFIAVADADRYLGALLRDFCAKKINIYIYNLCSVSADLVEKVLVISVTPE